MRLKNSMQNVLRSTDANFPSDANEASLHEVGEFADDALGAHVLPNGNGRDGLAGHSSQGYPLPEPAARPRRRKFDMVGMHLLKRELLAAERTDSALLPSRSSHRSNQRSWPSAVPVRRSRSDTPYRANSPRRPSHVHEKRAHFLSCTLAKPYHRPDTNTRRENAPSWAHLRLHAVRIRK